VDGAGAAVATQHRRLALLALLAAAGERGLTRDKLLAYLWPESPAENARHALEQLLYALRRQVHEALFLGTDPLHLNPRVITSDLAAFEEACARGAVTDAVALYRGPFLDGFYLRGAGEFERWVETERARLAERYAATLERLGRQAAAQGDRVAAVATWRKAVALDPFSSRAALGLMTALANAGERAEAIRHGRAYEALVRQEFGAEPAAAVSALLRRLLSQTGELDRASRSARDETAARSLPDGVVRNGAQPVGPTRPALEPSPADAPKLGFLAALAERYTVERELACGGMAIVFLARDVKHDRAVAIKVLRPELTAGLGPDRFQHEIQIAARLQHPHIVPLYDSGQADGLLYYVMPLVEGESLRDRLDRETHLPVEEALRITREVASALSYAHSHDLVHRDIKPENILLSGGEAVVADFGVARAITAAGGATLTETGIGLGTPAYTSPEAAAGSREVDGRADIYSLGCVLYEMLAGQPPFVGPTIESIVHQHLRAEAPPVPRIRTAVHPQVIDALHRALAKAPADRFATALQFAEAITVARGVAAPGPPPVERASAAMSKRWPRAVAGALAGLAALWLAVNPWGLRVRLFGRATTPRIHSLAVLPLQNLSGDPAQESFADGMTEALITNLGAIGGLGVISQTSAMHYKGTHQTIPEIARQLHVDAVVDGGVRREGNRVRITAELVEASTDRHLWAETYEGDLRNVLALEDEVARAIANEVKMRLSLQEQTRLARTRPVNPEAYDAYLKGRAASNEWTEGGLKRSIEYFAHAVKQDPGYAPAWAGLSDDYDLMGLFGFVPPLVALPKAKAAALRAIALDETLSEAHLSLAGVRMHLEWSWASAEEELRRAIALDPNNAMAHQWYGYYLIATGQFDKAIAEMQRALELDPLSWNKQSSLGEALMRAGRYDEALGYLREVPDADANSERHHLRIAAIYERKGMQREALGELLTALRLAGKAEIAASVERTYLSSGYPGAKKTFLWSDVRETERQAEAAYPRPRASQIAAEYALLGERDKAFAWLDRAFRERDGLLIYLKVDDRWDALQSDPRFRDLVRRIGLP
jgi:eukaryotic-like serine/threonine-protein kinase